MEKRNTRQEILDRSLDLFAVRGFQGVSVKAIAAAVGIKDSSLYKHFRSKQEIFDSLVAEMGRHYGEAIRLYSVPSGEAATAAEQYIVNDLAYLQKVCRANFLFLFKDPLASKFRRMLNIEQYQNSGAAAALCDFFLDTPLHYQTEMFREFMRRGFMPQGDPAVLALQFFAPFYLLLARYDGHPEQEAEALRRLDAHVAQFWNSYSAKGAPTP